MPARDRVAGEVTAEVVGTRRLLAGGDLAAAAATMTYFGGIALVPWLLLSVWSTTWVRDDAERRWSALRFLVPPDMGARTPYDDLVAAATHLHPAGALVLLFPASFYGEGMRRACLALAPQPDRLTGWRARIAVLGLAVLVPVAGAVLLLVGGWLLPLSPEGGGGGPLDLVVRVVGGFVTLWLLTTVALAWLFLAVAPGRPRLLVAVGGALATGSFLAGFLQGFWLFLSLPVDVGLPFAGLGVVGGVVAVGLWLSVLHVVVLTGWAATRALDLRLAGSR